eukprot:sb/3476819/
MPLYGGYGGYEMGILDGEWSVTGIPGLVRWGIITPLGTEGATQSTLLQLGGRDRRHSKRGYLEAAIRMIEETEPSIKTDRRDTSQQPLKTSYLGHLTGYQPIRDQCFLIRIHS